MKKFFLLGLFSALLTFKSHAQIFERNDFVIDAQMGLPNLSYWKSGFNGLAHIGINSNNDNEIYKSIGQFILNSEFFIDEKIGINISFNYGYYYNYIESTQTVYDGNTNTYTTNIYFQEKTTHRYRIYIGPNFHLLRTDRLDTYFGFKAGIKKSKIIKNNNYPDGYIIYDDISDIDIIPIGLRVCYGLRYLVGDRLLLNTEFGLGGPVVSLGLSYKITKNNY